LFCAFEDEKQIVIRVAPVQQRLRLWEGAPGLIVSRGVGAEHSGGRFIP